MDDIKFNWNASITAQPAKMEGDSLLISGELVNASVCANKFSIDELELPKFPEQLPSLTLRIDHSKSVRDVIGGLRPGTYDKENKRVMFEAEVDDPTIQRLINKGRLKYVSIGATADAFCSGCGKSSKPLKNCRCKDSHDVIKNVKLKEVSIITEPAYPSSEFKPVGFFASIETAISELESKNVTSDSSKEEGGKQNLNKKMEEREMSTETKVEATTLKPAGQDAVVLLGELGKKLEGITQRLEKLEEAKKIKVKEEDEDEAKPKKKDEDEDEAKTKKKESETLTKLEQAVSALVTRLENPCPPKEKEEEIPKNIPKIKKEPPTEEEEEEEEEPKKKEVPEKIKKEPVKGAKVEDANEQIIVTGDSIPAWFKEVKAFAEKKGILD